MNLVQEFQNQDFPITKGVSLKRKLRSIWASVVPLTSPVREFLEASSIHGLAYISKAESLWGKILWSISVIVSFSLAGILINNARTGWSAQPVSSVISTYPIRDLRFPNVTICPPQSTNTALNYDLFKLKNSFSPLEKDAISKEINNIFFDKEIQMYVRTLSEEIVNEENLVNIYKGFQAVPTHIGKTGYTVREAIILKKAEFYENFS